MNSSQDRTVDFDENTPITTRAYLDIQKSMREGNFNAPAGILRVLEAMKELEKIQFDYYRAMANPDVADGADS